MPLIVVYDPASLGVSNRVVRYHVSKSEPEFDSFANGLPYLVGPTLPSGFTGSNSRVDVGNVVLLTQQDLDSIETSNTKSLLDSRRVSYLLDKTPAAVLNKLGMNVKINEQ